MSEFLVVALSFVCSRMHRNDSSTCTSCVPHFSHLRVCTCRPSKIRLMRAASGVPAKKTKKTKKKKKRWKKETKKKNEEVHMCV